MTKTGSDNFEDRIRVVWIVKQTGGFGQGLYVIFDDNLWGVHGYFPRQESARRHDQNRRGHAERKIENFLKPVTVWSSRLYLATMA